MTAVIENRQAIGHRFRLGCGGQARSGYFTESVQTHVDFIPARRARRVCPFLAAIEVANVARFAAKGHWRPFVQLRTSPSPIVNQSGDRNWLRFAGISPAASKGRLRNK